MPGDTRMDPKDPWYIFFPNMLRRIGRIWNVKSYLRKHKSDPEPTQEPVVDTRQFNRMTTRWNGDGMLDWNLVEYLDTLPDSANVPSEIEKWNRKHGVSWGNSGEAVDFDIINADLKTTWDRLKECIDRRDAEITRLGRTEPDTENEYNVLHEQFDELEGRLVRPGVPAGTTESDLGGVRAMIIDQKQAGGSVVNPDAIRLLTATNVITTNEAREMLGVNKHD